MATSALIQASSTELIQNGTETTWAAILGSVDDGSFADFVAQIKASSLTQERGAVRLFYQGDRYDLRHGHSLKKNDSVIDNVHPRLDCSYGRIEWDAKNYVLEDDSGRWTASLKH